MALHPQFDQHFLDHAIRLGARGLGRTAPNPSVGCVLVKNGQVIAAARSADGVRPHVETQTFASAGTAAKGATAYVSLEPCAHHGNTPPCAQALIDAGIARVVIAAIDPDPRVAGRGIAMLEAAGIAVSIVPSPVGGGLGWGHSGHGARLCPPPTLPPTGRGMRATSSATILHDLYRGFFRRVQHDLPYVAMKLATSLDGKITDSAGHSQWITGEAARSGHVHILRAQFDAIVTGIGTVLADDPLFNVRLPGLAHPHCARIICDRRLRLPLASKLVASANMQPVWVITTAEAVEQAASHATELREAGIVLQVVEDTALAPLTILKTLAGNGIMRVLVEGGTGLSTSFLAANCVDTLYWYRAPLLLGNAGKPAVAALETSLTHAARWAPAESVPLGADRCDRYELTSCLPD